MLQKKFVSPSNRSNKQSAAVLLILSFIFAACSAKVQGGASDMPALAPSASDGFFDSKPTIVGVSLDGHWQSQCHSKPGSDLSRKFDFVVKSDQVSRSEQLFSDSLCSNSSAKTENHGRFRFIDQFQDGSFGVEYAFDQGGGMTIFPQEKILLKDGLLYLADFSTGDASMVLKDEPLSIVGSAQPSDPNPKPPTNPSLKPAQKAFSYQQARYAFCDTQGFATMIDFQGADLSKDGKGSAHMGFKACTSSEALQWSANSVQFVVTTKNGKPQISFPESKYETYVRPWGYQDGLGDYAASAAVEGNSGECFFLTNDGTQNLTFASGCY